jgi:xylan 1,4-beta-xylosidase
MPEEVDVLAARSGDGDAPGSVAVLVWRHTDDQYQTDDQAAVVSVSITGMTDGEHVLRHRRIDADHSNAHTVWTSLGSPQVPTEEELAQIKARQGLEELEPERRVTVTGGTLELSVELPLPAVSLLTLEPV